MIRLAYPHKALWRKPSNSISNGLQRRYAPGSLLTGNTRQAVGRDPGPVTAPCLNGEFLLAGSSAWYDTISVFNSMEYMQIILYSPLWRPVTLCGPPSMSHACHVVRNPTTLLYVLYRKTVLSSILIRYTVSKSAGSAERDIKVLVVMKDSIGREDIKLLIVYCPLLCVLWFLPEKIVEKVYLKRK